MYSHHSDKGTNVAGTPNFKLSEVLLEIGGWRLVRPLYPALLGVKSYIVHIECKREAPRTAQMMTSGGVHKVCSWCGETPPDEIAGLEILHNGKI